MKGEPYGGPPDHDMPIRRCCAHPRRCCISGCVERLAYNPEIAAEITGLRRQTITRLITSGELPARGIRDASGNVEYVIRRSDLQRWLEADGTKTELTESLLPVDWSPPRTLQEWAHIFRVDRKTIKKWFVQTNGILAEKVGSRWRVREADVPRSEYDAHMRRNE